MPERLFLLATVVLSPSRDVNVILFYICIVRVFGRSPFSTYPNYEKKMLRRLQPAEIFHFLVTLKMSFHNQTKFR